MTTKERPIIFDAESIKRIVDWRKKQTRRVIASPRHMRHETLHDAMTYAARDGVGDWVFSDFAMSLEFVLKAYPGGNGIRCPYGYPGDRLWVREVWTQFMDGMAYRADTTPFSEEQRKAYGVRWRSPIHMPRTASRLLLEITDIRVERLQSISDADAKAEGVKLFERTTTHYAGMWRDAFAERWDAINAKRGYTWKMNPWVWVIEFKLVQP